MALPAEHTPRVGVLPPNDEDGDDWDEHEEYEFYRDEEYEEDEYEAHVRVQLAENEERIAAINGERGVAAQRAAMGWTTD
jgi:hypothetical protein